MVKLVNIPKPWFLSVIWATWQFGGVTIKILILGVVHQGVTFPLFWYLLDKRGYSNTQERFDLLVTFLCAFEPTDIAYLTADREFLGNELFAWLVAEPITQFRIRIRKSELLWDGCQSLRISIVFQNLQLQQLKVFTETTTFGDIGSIWQACDLKIAHCSLLPPTTLLKLSFLIMLYVGELKLYLAFEL